QLETQLVSPALWQPVGQPAADMRSAERLMTAIAQQPAVTEHAICVDVSAMLTERMIEAVDREASDRVVARCPGEAAQVCPGAPPLSECRFAAAARVDQCRVRRHADTRDNVARGGRGCSGRDEEEEMAMVLRICRASRCEQVADQHHPHGSSWHHAR